MDEKPLNLDETPAPAEPIPPWQSSAFHKVFIGKEGLRAGWGLLIFFALLAAIMYGAVLLGDKLHPAASAGAKTASESIAISHILVSEYVLFLITLLVTWIMSKIEQRRNGVYGLGGIRKLPRFLAGLAWGVACLSLLVLILLKTGLLVIDSRLLFGREVFRYGAYWLLGFIAVGLLEEYLCRGYIQYTLSRGLAGLYQWGFKTPHSATLGFWTSAVIISLLFGLGHRSNPGESPVGLLSAGLASMVFCFSLWRTGSLWWAIGFHSAWDWAQSFLYGVADSGVTVPHHLLATHPVGRPVLSGGSTGPEGSIFIVVIVAIISLVIYLTLPGLHNRDT